jgi:hypothetical protein
VSIKGHKVKGVDVIVERDAGLAGAQAPGDGALGVVDNLYRTVSLF